MKKVTILGMSIIVLASCATARAASLEKAAMFNKHGLRNEAKKELIEVIFSKAPPSDKAEAYYLLGSIAFDERRVSVALDSWKIIVVKYPKSKEAALVKDRITELAEIVGESTGESIKNAIAQSYLRHADFWSRGKDLLFNIDSSWISSVESAIKWYDKVLREFPKTASAGCVPSIESAGTPSVSQSDFVVACDQVLSQQFGMLFWGREGLELPLLGGFLCVGGPLTRTPVQFSYGLGPGNCSGRLELQMDSAFFAANGMLPGDQIFCQWWYRDPGLLPAVPAGLSDGLEFTVLP